MTDKTTSTHLALEIKGFQDLQSIDCERMSVEQSTLMLNLTGFETHTNSISVAALLDANDEDLSASILEFKESVLNPLIQNTRQGKVLYLRLKMTDLACRVSVGAFIFLASSVSSPFVASISVFSVRKFMVETGFDFISLDTLATSIIPYGFPTSGALASLWDGQKVGCIKPISLDLIPTGAKDNLIDYAELY